MQGANKLRIGSFHTSCSFLSVKTGFPSLLTRLQRGRRVYAYHTANLRTGRNPDRESVKRELLCIEPSITLSSSQSTKFLVLVALVSTHPVEIC